jgi:hypothetical protein
MTATQSAGYYLAGILLASGLSSAAPSGRAAEWSAEHTYTVMTTFPLACPSSRYRIASGTSSNG